MRPTDPQIKLTVYLPKSHVDALEEEVFHRRRSGDRIGNTDLMREVVEQWLARRRGLTTPPIAQEEMPE